MKPVKTDIRFPELEKSVLKFWKDQGITQKGLYANQEKANEAGGRYVFYDGPPFATGMPHYGHILAGTLKDIVPRYWVMKGKFVERRWGWDCHGLPVEFEMENELGLSGVRDIEKYGVKNFNEACRGIVDRYTKEWETIVQRTGRWADFERGYRTMDLSFMESVWWVVAQLFNQGLIYEGYRVMPYSWRVATPLSNFEAGLNYKEVQDPSLTLRFKEVGSPRVFLAWTTTPWTLPSNLALAVGPEIDYVEITEVKTSDRLVLAKDRLATYFKNEADYRVEKTFKGKQLEGLKYEPLFAHFADQKGAFRILVGDHVTTTDGTGIVHTAPAFGEEDFALAKKYGIELVDPVDHEGKFTSAVPEYAGQNVKEADKAIIKDLKARGSIFKHETFLHNYPFCWRSDTPLIYKAISTWFVKLDPLKARLIANNQKTNWVPEHLRDGRFGNWLENARDWNISRNRFWGTPIPIWRTEDGSEMVCIGSVAELEKLSGRKFTDIHKHFVDDVVLTSKSGKPMHRIPEVLDCWFESGSMPYAQAHYPFENKETFEKNFPAQFIAEGIDQTRGWFYTLSVLSTALFDQPAFKNVIVNGLILAEDGKKMSKRLKNYPDPTHVMDTYGADAMRAYLMNSPASHAEDLRFSEAGVKEVVRSVILPLWNSYSFFVTYALADKWEPKSRAVVPDTLLDKWIVSRLESMIQLVNNLMKDYQLYIVVPEVLKFIDELTNWYIRLNRRRFWADGESQTKTSAYSTLYYVLTRFCKVLAPILPFVTEEIYQNLERDLNGKESVHLTSFPEAQEKWFDPTLEKHMKLFQRVVGMGRNCRSVNNLKTRQPLKEIYVITRSESDRSTIELFSDLIAQELNVKKVSFSNDESKWVSYVALPDLKKLGKKLGAGLKEVTSQIKGMTSAQIVEFETKQSATFAGKEIKFDEVLVQTVPLKAGAIQSEAGVTIWLNSEIDENLLFEGIAREFVNRVQKLRKDQQFVVTDRIHVKFETSEEISRAIEKNSTYIAGETLASSIKAGQGPWLTEQDIDGEVLKLAIEKA